MKISLNKANKLRQALESLAIPIPTTGVVRSTMLPGNIRKAVEEAREIMNKAGEKNAEKLMFVKIIRRIIDDANHESGISVILGDIAAIERCLAFGKAFERDQSYSRSSAADVEDIINAIEHAEKIAAAKPELAQPPKNYTVSLLTEEMKKEDTEGMKRFKLELEELKEKRNELNHSTHIELPKDMVEFLREFSLIK